MISRCIARAFGYQSGGKSDRQDRARDTFSAARRTIFWLKAFVAICDQSERFLQAKVWIRVRIGIGLDNLRLWEVVR